MAHDPSAAAPIPEDAGLAFIESLRVPVLFFDGAGRLRFMNAAAKRSLGQGLAARIEEHLRTRPDKAKMSQVKFRLDGGAERVLCIGVSKAEWLGQSGYQAVVHDVTEYLTAIQQSQPKATAPAAPADLSADVRQRTEELAAARQELEAILSRQMRMRQEEEARGKEFVELRRTLEKTEAERNALEARAGQAAGDAAEATRKLQEEAAARGRAEQEAAQARKEAADAAEDARRKLEAAEAAARNRAQQESAQDREEAAAALVNARKDLDAESAKRERLEHENALLQNKSGELNQSLAALQAERDRFDALARQRADDLAQATTALQDQASESKKSQERNEALALEVAGHKRAVEQIENHRAALAEEAKRLRDELAQVGERLRQETEDRERAQQEIAQARKQPTEVGEDARRKTEAMNAAREGAQQKTDQAPIEFIVVQTAAAPPAAIPPKSQKPRRAAAVVAWVVVPVLVVAGVVLLILYWSGRHTPPPVAPSKLATPIPTERRPPEKARP